MTSSLQVHLMVICKSPFLASSAHICMMFEHVEDAVSYSFILGVGEVLLDIQLLFA